MVKTQVYCTTHQGETIDQYYVTILDAEGKAISGVLPAKEIKGNKLEARTLAKQGIKFLLHLPRGFPMETIWINSERSLAA